MANNKSYTPEHLAYLERRYVDLKQVFEAMISYYPPEVYEDNYFFETIVCEFNYLADILGFEDESAFLDRLIGQSDEVEDDDDEEVDGDDDDAVAD